MNIELQNVLNEFIKTLNEVEILITSADANASEEEKYTTFNKSALLLLTGKFENFVEVLAEEYLYEINRLNLPASRIPEMLKLHHSYKSLEKLNIHINKNDVDEIKKRFYELGTIWVSNDNFGNLDIDCKFAYGKHGENEFRKLFNQLGINDVFQEINVFVPDETLGTDTKTQIDFRGIFNSVIGMRNNILHQDATPSLTHSDIRKYKTIFQIFAEQLTISLDSQLSGISV